MASLRRITRRQALLTSVAALAAVAVGVFGVPGTSVAPMLSTPPAGIPGVPSEGGAGPAFVADSATDGAPDARGLLPPVEAAGVADAATVPLPPLGRPMPGPWAEPPAMARRLPVPDLSASAAVVVDEASGEVLLGFNEHARLAPASLTKMATAILAAEAGSLDREVEVDVDSRKMVNSSLMGLRPGDRFTLRDLLYGLMLPSGNDAALAIGRELSGSDEAFVDELNALARRLGLTETRFVNPHGLSRPGHYSSAHDLAIIARYYMSLDPLPEIAATHSWLAEGSREIEMRTLNPLLASYEGADGVKTGYTKKSGPTFVASATRNGHRVYVVVLNDRKRALDARSLLDWAFTTHRWSDHDLDAAPVRIAPAEPVVEVLRGPRAG